MSRLIGIEIKFDDEQPTCLLVFQNCVEFDSYLINKCRVIFLAFESEHCKLKSKYSILMTTEIKRNSSIFIS